MAEALRNPDRTVVEGPRRYGCTAVPWSVVRTGIVAYLTPTATAARTAGAAPTCTHAVPRS